MTARRQSIAAIFASSLVFTTTVVLLAFAALNYWQDVSRERATLQLETERSAAQLAIALQSPAWNFDRQQIEGLIGSTLQNRDIQSVSVELDGSASHTRYAFGRDPQWRPRSLAAQPAPPTDGTTVTRPILVVVPAAVTHRGNDNDQLGTVTVNSTFGFARAQLHRTLALTLTAILASDLLLIATLYLLAWRLVLNPLQALRAHAAEVAGGSSSAPTIGSAHFRGEFEELRQSLDTMLQLLQQRYQELQLEQQRYRKLVTDMFRVQDTERRRLGRDLHDGAGQTLAALEIDLDRLRQRLSAADTGTQRLLQESITLAKQCLLEIRTTSYLLHPPLLDELGLATALRWLADGFRARSQIALRLGVPESMDRLRPNVELALFHVAQEALSNVFRHSDAGQAGLQLECDAESVTLTIDDNGKGLGTSRHGHGVGLPGMSERMQQIGGELTIKSDPSGTQVVARLKLVHEGTTPESAAPIPPGQNFPRE